MSDLCASSICIKREPPSAIKNPPSLQPHSRNLPNRGLPSKQEMKFTTAVIASVAYLTSQVATAPCSLGQTPMTATDVYSDSVLTIHNRHRAQYGAKPLTWSPELYTSALQYAKLCKFASSDSRGKVLSG